MTTTEHAALIRQTLKARHGWTSRDISVRTDTYSMGSSIRIQIKRADVPLSVVEAIAQPAERIDRDQWGDILSGGNRFVFTEYSSYALDVLCSRYIDAVNAAIAQLSPEGSACSLLVPVEGTPYMVGRDTHGNCLSVWDINTHRGSFHSPEGVARWIGQRMVEAVR